MTYLHIIRSRRKIGTFHAWQLDAFIGRRRPKVLIPQWNVRLFGIDCASFGFTRMPMHRVSVTIFNFIVGLRFSRHLSQAINPAGGERG